MTKPRPPLCVYLLFHKDSEQGRDLAKRMYHWLRLHDYDGDGGAVGIPVYFRVDVQDDCDPDEPVVVLPPPLLEIPRPKLPDDAQHLFIVPLVDEWMVADPKWRKALLRMAQAHDWDRGSTEGSTTRDPEVSLLPVMVDRSFSSLGDLAKGHNPLRIWDPADEEPGPPPPPPPPLVPADPYEDERRTQEHARAKDDHAKRVERWCDGRARRLRRALTEQMIRELDNAGGTDRPERLKVFLSHAKANGAMIAQRIRDRLASVSKLEAWFDQNDLVAGHAADTAMETAAKESSGGMIAVVTDAYPTRPWCWREARAARTPRRVPSLKYFTALPTVAVHVARAHWARLPPSLGGVARIGWPPEGPELVRTSIENPMGMELASYRASEERARHVDMRVGDIVDRLLLELLMQRVHHRMGRDLLAEDPSVWFVDFILDARSLPLVLAETRKDDPEGETEIVYPGHGLRAAEHQDLEETIEAIGSKAKLVPLEVKQQRRLGSGSDPAKALPQQSIVAISAGGTEIELLDSGLSEAHVDDFTVRLTRLLLQNRWRVGFGGAIQPANVERNLTRALLDAARGWFGGDPGDWGDTTKDKELRGRPPIPRRRLRSWATWRGDSTRR